MREYRVVHDLDEAAAAAKTDAFLVGGEELLRWVEEVRRARAAVLEERQACRKIVEDQLRLYLEERGLNAAMIMDHMIREIDERGTPAMPGTPVAEPVSGR